MIPYFGYGSNIDATSLAAKGVVPKRSRLARLEGWRLRFNVEHFFRHEGGMGNIEHTGDPGDYVLGMLHECSDADLAALDKVEAYGIGYDRIELSVVLEDGTQTGAIAYVGLPDFLNDTCRPTRRYLNIITRGAYAAGFEAKYIAALKAQPLLIWPDLAPFAPPDFGVRLAATDIADHPTMTILCDHVFDLSQRRPRHDILQSWFGGKDTTLFILNRADASDGTDTLDDVRAGRLSEAQKSYMNRYLHAFDEEYLYAGRASSV